MSGINVFYLLSMSIVATGLVDLRVGLEWAMRTFGPHSELTLWRKLP